MDGEAEIARKWDLISPHLNERQRRLWAGGEARSIGRGGIAAVSRATGMSRSTLQDAVGEIDAGPEATDRIRRPGAGRKKLVDPTAWGDPMSPLRWTAKSVRTLARELTDQGHPISASKVGQLLAQMGYSLQAPVKEVEGCRP